MRKLGIGWTLGAWAALGLLYVPLLAVVAGSVNASRTGMAWTGFTLRWYRELFVNERLWEYVRNTGVLALVSTAIATLLGTGLGYGMSRFWFPGKKLFSMLMYIPVMIPDIVMAVAMLSFFALIRSWVGLFELGMFTMIIAHVTFCFPLVLVTVQARLADLDPALDEAALDLGATPLIAFWRVIVPCIAHNLADCRRVIILDAATQPKCQ